MDKNPGVARGWVEGMNWQSTEDFYLSETSLYDTIMAGKCHYTFVQIYRIYSTQVNPNVNYGLRIIMMCECRFIGFNTCTFGPDVDNRGSYTCVGGEGTWELYTFCSTLL